MSTKKPSKKKVFATKATKNVVQTKKKISPTISRSKAAATTVAKRELIFGKQNYIWMAIGAGLVALGLIMMLGGSMPSPDVWDPDIIYSFRITVIAPILILAGLIVEIYAIFK